LFEEMRRNALKPLESLGKMESSWHERGAIVLLNLEDEEDASKLHFPSSMRPYQLQHTYKQMSNSSIIYI
jgi:hypothetical protein